MQMFTNDALARPTQRSHPHSENGDAIVESVKPRRRWCVSPPGLNIKSKSSSQGYAPPRVVSTTPTHAICGTESVSHETTG